MPAANQGADDPAQDWTVARALLLLEQALEIIDAWGNSPAIGARLQHVIDDVQALEPPTAASVTSH